MNLVPEVIVIIMSVVVLSLVRLRSFLFFFLCWGTRQIVCTENEREKEDDEISLSLCLFVGLEKQK